MAAITVTNPVFGQNIQVVPSIRIDVGFYRHVEIIIEYFIITYPVKTQTILGTYIEGGRKKTGMSARRDREISKGNIDGNGYALKFRMHRARYGHLFIDQFHFICSKCEMGCIQITGRKTSMKLIIIVLGYFLHLL